MPRWDGASPATLWLVPPRRLDAALRAAGPGARWCYLGTDVAQRQRIGARVEPPREGISEPLTRVALALKPAFLDWISAIGARQPRPAVWCGARMASRSPVQSDLFLLMCYAELVARWAAEPPSAARVVAIEDPWLLRMVRARWGRAPHVRAPWTDAPRRWRWLLASIARAPRRWLRGLGQALGLWLRGRLAPSEEPAGAPWDAVLLSWLSPHAFGPTGEFHDAYLGRLGEILRAHGQRIARLSPLPIAAPLWRTLRGRADFLLTPRCLRLADIARAATQPFRLAGRRELSRVAGHDVAPLVWRELVCEWTDGSFLFYQLTYRAFRRVARRLRGRARALIYPFENQPWEKQLCLAFREEAPEVQLIGYQHTSMGPLWLSYALGRDELRWAPLPDRIVANGPLGERRLREGGFPPERLANGGSLRFEHLFDRPTAARPPRRPDGAARVLVALPFSRPHALALLQALREQFPRPVLDAAGRAPVTFLIKAHPTLPLEALLDEPLPAWFASRAQPLAELFAHADAFLYVPPTMTCWEAYAAGLPVLKYVDDLLDIDSLEGLDAAAAACTRPTLRDELARLIRIEADPQRHRDAMARAFAPIDEAAWRALTPAGAAP